MLSRSKILPAEVPYRCKAYSYSYRRPRVSPRPSSSRRTPHCSLGRSSLYPRQPIPETHKSASTEHGFNSINKAVKPTSVAGRPRWLVQITDSVALVRPCVRWPTARAELREHRLHPCGAWDVCSAARGFVRQPVWHHWHSVWRRRNVGGTKKWRGTSRRQSAPSSTRRPSPGVDHSTRPRRGMLPRTARTWGARTSVHAPGGRTSLVPAAEAGATRERASPAPSRRGSLVAVRAGRAAPRAPHRRPPACGARISLRAPGGRTNFVPAAEADAKRRRAPPAPPRRGRCGPTRRPAAGAW